MSDSAALEEVSALAAIYCKPGEFELLETAETNGITLRIQISVKWPMRSDIHLKLTFHLPVNYPTCLPNISVTSEDLTRAQCKGIQGKLREHAQELLCEPMVHELVLWIQGHLGHVIGTLDPPICDFKATVPSGTPDDGTWTVLLQLDHMRAKTKYVKTVENWASDLSLTGRVMFMGKLILILLQGDKENIKEYLILQKTSKVDVDSCGKKCKEKMSTILYEAKIPSGQPRFLEFQVKEYSSLDDLHKEFVEVKLGNIFTDLVLTQFR